MATLTIASLNVRFGISPATEEPFDVTAAVAALDADIVALQEIWCPREGPAAHSVAAAALGYEVAELRLPRAHNKTSPPLIRTVDGASGTWWGVAVLSRPPIVEQGSLDFADVWFDECSRRALVVRASAPWGRPITIVTPHLTYRPWGSFGHLRTLRRHCANLEGDVVVLGDFNMWGPVVDRLVPGWQRPVRGRTWPVPRPHSQLDHVLLSSGLVARDPVVLPAVGSDHRPVRVSIAPR